MFLTNNDKAAGAPKPADTSGGILPRDNTRQHEVRVAEGLGLPAKHIEHIGLGTRLLHRTELIVGVAAVKAVFHSVKRRKTYSELDKLEKQQKLSDSDTTTLVTEVVGLNEHARTKDVSAMVKAAGLADGTARNEKTTAQKLEVMQQRYNKALTEIGVTPGPAKPAPELQAVTTTASSNGPVDFTIHYGYKGKATLEAIGHYLRSFPFNVTDDKSKNGNFLTFVRSHPELLKLQAEMDKEAQGKTPKEREAMEDRFMAQVSENWNKIHDPATREKWMELAGARSIRNVDQRREESQQLSEMTSRVEQAEAVADQVKILKQQPPAPHKGLDILSLAPMDTPSIIPDNPGRAAGVSAPAAK